MLCNAVKWDERYWALGATGHQAARYRLGTGQPTRETLQRAKLWQDSLCADTRKSLREALCAEETEGVSGGAALELDQVCTASFAGTQGTIHFTGDMGKHVSAKAHLLYIEVPKGSETSHLPPGFGRKLAAQGVPTILFGPNARTPLPFVIFLSFTINATDTQLIGWHFTRFRCVADCPVRMLGLHMLITGVLRFTGSCKEQGGATSRRKTAQNTMKLPVRGPFGTVVHCQQ